METPEDIPSVEQVLFSLGEALLEALKEHQEPQDVFEIYVHHLRAKTHFNRKDYCSALYKGYLALRRVKDEG